MMTSGHFLKIFKDSDLLDEKYLTSTRIDIIFNKVKVRGSSKIDFHQFLDGLVEVSREKKMKLQEIVDKIVNLK